MAKYVIITGGVVSGLGKGITAASLGRLLKARGYKITLQKFDPYFNVDSSNLSPYQHGEVFVTTDGGETDPVVGHYERFIDENLTADSDITSGKVYSTVIENERLGKYSGGTVQVVPHITDEIKNRLLKPTGDDAIVIVDVGGTVGDIECHPFLEAFKQLKVQIGKDNIAYVHVSFVPFIEMSGEQKTKPTQHSVKELQNVGIQPDVIVCRTDYALEKGSKKKIAAFCNVQVDCIIEDMTNDHVLEIPLMLEREGFASAVLRKLKLEDRKPELEVWERIVSRTKENADKRTRLAVIGKYVEKHDAYVSLFEALKYSAIDTSVRFDLDWISSETITADSAGSILSGYDGIIIGAGFGERGFDGKLIAAKFAREANLPCLMIGMGAQAGYIEFAQNVLGIKDAASEEFSPDARNHLVTGIMGGLKKGSHITLVEKNSKLGEIYGRAEINMRHRHRYDMNGIYAVRLQHAGLTISGKNESGNIDAFELSANRFYMGVSFRPEFEARIGKPDPLISAFLVSAAGEERQKERTV